jgi:hypothetical protein
LLANGAQQLLSIQPQLLALQQQQQPSPDHSFYRKLHQGHNMEPPEMSSRSPPLHSRKDQMSINTFKMRNREMSKRLARMSSRPLNGHDQHHHHQMENESRSPAASPRVPTTNGESSKPINAEPSQTSPKSFHHQQQPQSPASKSSLDYRAMRELLGESEKRSESHFSMEQQQQQQQQSPREQHQHHHQQPQTHNGGQLKINQALQEKIAEKAERESSPHSHDNQQPITLPSSPMQFSNDSNSGDGNFDDLQSEFCV